MTNTKRLFPALFFLCFLGISCNAPGKKNNNTTIHPPCCEDSIPTYTAQRIKQAPVIDGKLDEAVWENAPRSSRFVDLIHGTETYMDTRAAVLWDDDYLYVGYWLEEPNVTATLTERDAPIYQDNDAELFIAGADGYYEFEINSFGTIYEVLFFWQEEFEKKGYGQLAELDTTREGVRPFNGVGYKNHPRGKRIGFWNWDFPGLQSAVHINGTINKPDDTDKGWTVELALPWKGLELLAKGDGRALPPKDGDVWRMDFSRFNTHKKDTTDSGGWAWSSHGVWDSHVPECFTYITFSNQVIE
ncbi:carbohydrate-binding family 9-like protein [Parapedobacter lycopersici]|uniref:carbohydrate-binding family 9-like protein n=1 Tax=Parapedobacter lycopersici TaxID=1864939 RepID=UPI00214DE41C|nr:carbohydrate-binding family 9-like protein [Parapedobacter lycopersici]